MKLKHKLIYGIAGLLGFLPLSLLVIMQSIFALEASYDSKLIIDASMITINEMIVYDKYNDIITHIETRDSDGKPVLYSVIEATEKYAIINYHGTKNTPISNIQFITIEGNKTELLNGIVYLKFENVDMTQYSPLQEFIQDTIITYKEYFEKPAGTISYLWVQIIAASLGTIIGLITVLIVVLRKSTKALVKRYWRIAVLVGLIEGTIILGFIAWIATDMFQVFASATLGWMLFLGTEKLAKIKGYLDTASTASLLPDELPLEAIEDVEARFNNLIASYRK